MKYKSRINSLKNQIADIYKNVFKLASKTYWLQDGTYRSSNLEFKAVKNGSKPMGLLFPSDEKIIKKAKKFVDETNGYSWSETDEGHFIYGKNFNVYAAKLPSMQSEVALGLLLGYSKNHVAAYEFRNLLRSGLKIHTPIRPIRSRNPIADVLSGKQSLVEINFKPDKGVLVDAKTVNKKILELSKQVEKDKSLDFVVLYKGKYGNPFIIFGKKHLTKQISI